MKSFLCFAAIIKFNFFQVFIGMLLFCSTCKKIKKKKVRIPKIIMAEEHIYRGDISLIKKNSVLQSRFFCSIEVEKKNK